MPSGNQSEKGLSQGCYLEKNLKVVFDKTAFAKFKISNKFNKTCTLKFIGKSKPASGFWNLKKKSANQKSCDFCQMFVIPRKKTIPLGMDLKMYRKSIANLFLFFVFSSSGDQAIEKSVNTVNT
jgi:hypothetical protein